MSRFLHQPLAGAPYEPYGGPPGRLDVADLVTTANSSADNAASTSRCSPNDHRVTSRSITATTTTGYPRNRTNRNLFESHHKQNDSKQTELVLTPLTTATD